MATTSTRPRRLEELGQQHPSRAPDRRSVPRERDRRTAGLLLASAGAAVFMAIITAEALYPPRSTPQTTRSAISARRSLRTA